MPTTREIPQAVRAGKAIGAAIAANLIVKLEGSEVDAVEIATAATDTLYGVSAAAILQDKTGDIYTEGKARVTSGAAVSIGARITADAAGKGVTASPGAGTNNGVIGLAITAAAGANELIEVELSGPGATLQG